VDVDYPPELRMSFGKEKRIKANLVIPVRDIVDGKVKELVWTIRSGPVTDYVRGAWEQFKTGRDPRERDPHKDREERKKEEKDRD
jgi:hypothetical protein